jgi:2-succinyl-6-hydroxy-2,4-cyclohexadiene-1-carboxylate synthase
VPESLVLLHGFASTRRLWDAVIARLPPERYSPLALDLLGHGSQADAPRPITFEGCVSHVLARAPESFVLVGYSMGGRVALHVALAAPERVSRLVLISATPGIEDAAQRAERAVRDRRLAERIERGTIEELVELWRSQPMFAEDPPEVDALARAEMARHPPAGVAAALRGIGTGEMSPLWDRLGELTMPVAIVVGERDARFRAVAERMVRELPAARVEVMPGGHVLPLESPQSVAGAILTPARCPGPGPAAPGSGRRPGRGGPPSL